MGAGLGHRVYISWNGLKFKLSKTAPMKGLSEVNINKHTKYDHFYCKGLKDKEQINLS
jgi:hypothetical protein